MKKLKILLAAVMVLVGATVLSGCFDKDTLKLTLTTENNVTHVKPGDEVQFETSIIGQEIGIVSYDITVGDNYATITDDGLLKVSADALVGGTITVVSKLGSVKSNAVSLTVVDIPLTGVSLSVNKVKIAPGGNAKLTAVLTPTNTTQSVEYVIVEGGDIAELSGDFVIVSEDAEAGREIKIKAVKGTIESNVVTLTVEVEAVEAYYINLGDTITVKHPSTIASKITAVVRDATFQPVAGQNVYFEIINGGEEFLEITPNGYDCGLTILGHGKATVRATLDNGVSATVLVDCIKTPDQIQLPEVFIQRNDIHYAVSNKTPLAFGVVASGNKVCPDITYTFEKGTYDDEVLNFVPETTTGEIGTYDFTTKQIKFNKSFTGIVRLVATSNSGNTGHEVSSSQIFTVNEGVNVSTWEELSAVLKNNHLNPGRPINIVVLNKPTATNPSHTYGYDVVPSGILNGTQTDMYLANLYVGVSGSLNLNGNSHAINLEKMRQHSITSDDIFDFLISVRPITSSILDILNGRPSNWPLLNHYLTEYNNAILANEFTVNINDFVLIGNNSVTGVGTSGNKLGSFGEGIRVGWDGYPNKDKMYLPDEPEGVYLGKIACKLTMNNVDISKFVTGIRLKHVVDGHISNTTVSNCFETGLKISSSIVTLENMNYVYNGGFGVDFDAKDANKAGVNFDQKQKVTFAGSVSGYNMHNGQTPHIQTLNGLISGALNGNVTIFDLLRLTHGQDTEFTNVTKFNEVANGNEYSFVGFIFNYPEPNLSEYDFQGDIIEYTEEVNTTSKYIMLPVKVPQMGNMLVAYIIAANLNYVG